MYSVLVFLLDEVRELKEIAEARLYVPLIMFGQVPMLSIAPSHAMPLD